MSNLAKLYKELYETVLDRLKEYENCYNCKHFRWDNQIRKCKLTGECCEGWCEDWEK